MGLLVTHREPTPEETWGKAKGQARMITPRVQGLHRVGLGIATF